MSDDDGGGSGIGAEYADGDDYDDDFEDAAEDYGADDLPGPLRSPSPSQQQLRRSNDALLAEARVSVMGSELARALDSALMQRPSTGALNKSTAFPNGAAAAGVGGATPSVAGGARPLTGGIRQSQDLFSALDLAHTHGAGIKQNFDAYWTAVEEQFRAEQQAEEQLRERRTKEAEKKHLQRLKAKMAQTQAQAREASAAAAAFAKQEAGWDSGFVFDKPAGGALAATAAAPFDRPSVVKAQATLANLQATGAFGGANMASTTTGVLQQQQRAPSGSPQHGRRTSALVSGSPSGASGNAKAMPPAPSGVVDPARVRSLVQTHMPAVVLATLAARHRRPAAAAAGTTRPQSTKGTAAAASRSRKGSAARTRPSVSRQGSTVSVGDDGGAGPSMFSEEISPAHGGHMRSAFSSTREHNSSGSMSGASSAARPQQTQQQQPRGPPSRVTSAKHARPSGATVTNPRAASAGSVKPTHASALLAAERVAQMAAAAAANAPETKTIPLTTYNRMRHEIQELRRKLGALEAENATLRATAADHAVAEEINTAIVAAVRPSPSAMRRASTGLRQAGPTSAIPVLAATAAVPVAAAAAASRTSPPPVKSKGPGFKLNLAALRPDENGDLRMPAEVASTLSATNQLLSPRSKCAVSDCGASRVGGKPYCSKHAEEQSAGSQAPSARAAAPDEAITAAGSAAAAESSSAVVEPQPQLQGLGMHGMRFALGGASIGKYNYDYESDDNYGGTDLDDSDDDSDDASASRSNVGNDDDDDGGGGGNEADHVGHALAAEDDVREEYSEDFESPAPINGGDTQRQGTGTARAPASSRSGGLRTSPSLPAPAQPQPQLPHHSNALYSARDRFMIPPPRPSPSDATPRMVSRSGAVDMTAGSGNGNAGGVGVGGGGVFDLESLRQSPYANLDALGGSFEITQSGTFKRGGFELNKRGMLASPPPLSAVQTERQMANMQFPSARSGRAFPWDGGSSAAGGGSTDRAGLTTPSSGGAQAASSSSSSVAPSPHTMLLHRAGSGASTSSRVSTPSSGSGLSSTLSSPTPQQQLQRPFFRPLSAKDLYMLGVLGRGSSGVVYKAFYAPTVELLAVKAISIVEKDKRKQLTQELRTLTLAPNNYTIGFRGAYFDEAHIYIALEFMDGGSLDDLREQQTFLSEIELAFIFEQVLKGLKHLHRHHIIHRDIKPHNILYNSAACLLEGTKVQLAAGSLIAAEDVLDPALHPDTAPTLLRSAHSEHVLVESVDTRFADEVWRIEYKGKGGAIGHHKSYTVTKDHRLTLLCASSPTVRLLHTLPAGWLIQLTYLRPDGAMVCASYHVHIGGEIDLVASTNAARPREVDEDNEDGGEGQPLFTEEEEIQLQQEREYASDERFDCDQHVGLVCSLLNAAHGAASKSEALALFKASFLRAAHPNKYLLRGDPIDISVEQLVDNWTQLRMDDDEDDDVDESNDHAVGSSMEHKHRSPRPMLRGFVLPDLSTAPSLLLPTPEHSERNATCVTYMLPDELPSCSRKDAALSTSNRLESTHAALQIPTMMGCNHVGDGVNVVGSIEHALSLTETNNVVAFGRSNQMRWSHFVAQALQDGVFQPIAGESSTSSWEHGVCRLRVQRRVLSGSWAPLTVWFAPDPAAWHLAPALTTAIGLAHGVSLERIEASRRDLSGSIGVALARPVRLHKDDRCGSERGRPFRVINIAIAASREADKRYVLEGGSVTHNSVKLTDFGIVSDLKERSEASQVAQATTFLGTFLYLSPERVAGAAYSYAADIWSMALALLTCRVGHFAIPHNSHWELVNAIQTGPAILNNYSSDQVSDTLRDLLSSCLRTNPSERPTAAECLRHPFFSHFRTNGAAMPIPCPPGFPPPKPSSSPSEEAAGATVGDGERSERSERRARKALEIEQRNERHMLEQVCKLMVQRGMTSRPSTAATTAASASASASPLPSDAAAAAAAVVPSSSPRRPVSAPLDPKLCDRICARLSSLLKVPAAAVRTVLVQQHNQYVGLAVP